MRVLVLAAALSGILAASARAEHRETLAGVLVPAGLGVDPTPSSTANGNGVLEAGETATVAPSWRNPTAGTVSTGGVDTGMAGPGSPDPSHAVTDHTAAYGDIPAGAVVSCAGTGDCYAVQVGVPTARPAPHWDAVFSERLDEGSVKTWLLHVGDSFTDVPRTSGFYRFVETLFHAGVTGGCGPALYCPSNAATRQEMAVFVLASREGRFFAPEPCVEGATVFNDLPAASGFCPWVQELARRGVVSGCGGGAYCPASPVSREQMAVFALLTREGSGYAPPPCVAGSEAFNDVPASSPFCRWIEELARRGVVSGCGGGAYCPGGPVTREQMSVFLTRTFDLSLYGPSPSVHVVTTAADTTTPCTVAECSLRGAIASANGSPNLAGQRDEIRFLIPGPGVQTLVPASELPAITDPVVIDGFSQPGARANGRPAPQGLDGLPLIEVNGTNSSSHILSVLSESTLVRGLVLNRGPVGIEFRDVNSGAVEGCSIGTDAAGGAALGMRFDGVRLTSSDNVVIGGTRPSARNLISGNGQALSLLGSFNKVQGNLIGSNAANTAVLANQSGIRIRGNTHLENADANEVGGAQPGVYNVIVGSAIEGVNVDGLVGGSLILAHGNRIQSNFIGTNGLGVDMPNGIGVSLTGGSAVIGTVVGGTSTAFPSGNVIRANRRGVVDGGVGSHVEGNLITANGSGVEVAAGSGFHEFVSGNTISFNTGAGVFVQGGSPVRIQGNAILGNSGLGIDLAPAGVTPNDPGDGDTGANGLQNFPVLTGAQRLSSGLHVLGTLNSRPSQTFTIDVYASAAPDASGFGEGERFLGSIGLSTDASGNGAFDALVAGTAQAGERLTATATDAAGNTSEFSAVVSVP